MPTEVIKRFNENRVEFFLSEGKLWGVSSYLLSKFQPGFALQNIDDKKEITPNFMWLPCKNELKLLLRALPP